MPMVTPQTLSESEYWRERAAKQARNLRRERNRSAHVFYFVCALVLIPVALAIFS